MEPSTINSQEKMTEPPNFTDDDSFFDSEKWNLVVASWLILIVLLIVALALCLYQRRRNKAAITL